MTCMGSGCGVFGQTVRKMPIGTQLPVTGRSADEGNAVLASLKSPVDGSEVPMDIIISSHSDNASAAVGTSSHIAEEKEVRRMAPKVMWKD